MKLFYSQTPPQILQQRAVFFILNIMITISLSDYKNYGDVEKNIHSFKDKNGLWKYFRFIHPKVKGVFVYFIDLSPYNTVNYGLSIDLFHIYTALNKQGYLEDGVNAALCIEYFNSWEDALEFIGDMTDGTEFRYSPTSNLLDDANDIIKNN